MKKSNVLAAFAIILFSLSANAQIWEKIKKKAEQTADQKMDEVLHGKNKKSKGEKQKIKIRKPRQMRQPILLFKM